jgi:hypothetical protein
MDSIGYTGANKCRIFQGKSNNKIALCSEITEQSSRFYILQPVILHSNFTCHNESVGWEE